MAGDALQTIRDLVLIVAGLTVVVSAVVVTYQISRLTKRIEVWLDRIDRFSQGAAKVKGFVGPAAEVFKLAMSAFFTGVPSPLRTVVSASGAVQRILKVFRRRKR